MSIATKVLVVDLYIVQYAVPARKSKTQNKPQKQTNKNKKTTNQQQKPKNKAKTKQPKTPRSGIATSNGDSCGLAQVSFHLMYIYYLYIYIIYINNIYKYKNE